MGVTGSDEGYWEPIEILKSFTKYWGTHTNTHCAHCVHHKLRTLYTTQTIVCAHHTL